MKCKVLHACALLAMFGGACAAQQETREVDVSERGQVSRVEYGRIIGVDKVEVSGTDRYEGALLGAVLGGVAGAVIGPGTRGSIAGGVIGAIAGGLAGRKVQEELRDDGWEYEIRLETGETVSVIELHDEPLPPGEEVRLVFGEDTVRIEPQYRRPHVSRR